SRTPSTSSTTSTANTTPTKTKGRKEKMTIAKFSPISRKLAGDSHTRMRVDLATVNAFPASGDRDGMTWDSIITAGSSGVLQAKTTELLNQEVKKGLMIDYVWASASQIRGEVKTKAQRAISGEYGIPGTMKPEEIRDLVGWLLHKGNFMQGDLDTKARTFSKSRPYCHPIFKNIIQAQWFGRRGEGIRFHEDFRNIPLPIFALVITAVENALREYSTGPQVFINFTDPNFRSRYVYYVDRLQNVETKSPKWFLAMRSDLYNTILDQANLSHLKEDEEAEDDDIDYAALESTMAASSS
ncbi:hypothetical protein PLICRDRAFT_109510, partial [Plicaturopsis crispa FD-325 SS-3]